MLDFIANGPEGAETSYHVSVLMDSEVAVCKVRQRGELIRIVSGRYTSGRFTFKGLCEGEHAAINRGWRAFVTAQNPDLTGPELSLIWGF